MQVTIRKAGPSDATQIFEFISALADYEKEPDAVVATPDGLRAQLEEPNPPFECYFGDLDGSAAGFALFFSNYSTWRGRPGLYLEDLFVLPRFRKQGVGIALLRHLGKLAVERGCGRMEWSCLDWNTPAIDFYVKLGAVPMDGWTTFRLTGDALARLGQG